MLLREIRGMPLHSSLPTLLFIIITTVQYSKYFFKNEQFKYSCRELITSGRWKISSADGFVMFPGSDHSESVVVFDKI